MDTLFTTAIIIEGQPQDYHVTFSNEVYHFTPDGKTSAPTFGLRRADDEWKLEGDLNEISKSQAVNTLESYLLSQH